MNYDKIVQCALGALLLGTANQSVYAQQGLEEVIVTAQKRAQSLQDVPVSVSVLSSGDLTALRLTSANDIPAQVPNLQASSIIGDGMPIFAIRGVSMNDYSLNQNSPIAIYVDEVYKGNPGTQAVTLFDLDRIEVLRGPQGTLYGKNSTGGAINFITEKPRFENGGYLTMGAGNFDLLEANGAINLAASETLALRLAGTWKEADGWLENQNPGIDDANSLDEQGIRLSVAWLPRETAEIILRASHGKSNGVNYGIVADNVGEAGIGNGVYGLYYALGGASAVDATREGLDHWEFESERDERRLLETDSVSLTMNFDLSEDLLLTSISSWDDGEAYNPEDGDGTFNQLITLPYYAEVEAISQDLRITSNYDGAFNFIAGLYYGSEDVTNETTIKYAQDIDFNLDGNLDYLDCADPLFSALDPGSVSEAGMAADEILQGFGLSLADFAIFGCQTQNGFDQKRTSVAVYFDGSYDIDEHWTLQAGIRYTEDETKLQDFGARVLGNDDLVLLATIPFDPVDPFATIEDRKIEDEEVTGRLGIDYTTSNGDLIYASISHGYRTGAFNAQAFTDISEVTEVDPETLDAFEVGMKSTLVDGSLQLNGAVFFYSYKDQQFLDIDENAIQRLVNIEESEIYGFEMEAIGRVSDDLVVRAGLGWLDSEVKKGVLSGQDLSGNELPQSPDTNFNFAVDWDMWQVESGTVSLNVNGTYTSEQFYEVSNVDHTEADAYWVVNGRLAFESSDARWGVAIWGANLFEEEYQTSVVDLQAFFGYNYAHVGAPRTYGAELTFRFD